MSGGRIERPKGTHDVVPAEMPLWHRGSRRGRAPLRALRLPQDPDARVRGHRAVRPHLRSGIGRRPEGDVQLHGPLGSPADAPPEGTAPICRAYVEHGMHREPQPLKLFTIAPMYRYGAPGKGRYREHWQASVEAIGTDDPAIDAELIQLYDTLLHRLGVIVVPPRAELDRLRHLPSGLSRDASRVARDERASPRRRDAAKVATSPLRVFDNYLAKPEAVRVALDEAPTIGESLCEECVEQFARVRADLDATGVAYTLVPTLVRGLDYYTRTTWEFIGPMENENSTISGGGRYDGLVEEIGGPPTPGVGFGAGSSGC